MPKFLDRLEIFDLFFRELPEDVYQYTAPTGSYSAASIDAKSAVAASGYANLNRIYDNYFPLNCDEKLGDWLEMVFGSPVQVKDTLQGNREAIVAKLRSRAGLTISDMINVVKQVVGLTTVVEIAEWGCETGTWVISESELSISTILGGTRLEDAVGPFLCEQSPSDFGKTQAEWDEMREQAYTYEVRIYDYILTTEQRDELEKLLKKSEPARSGHVITDNLPLSELLDGDT